jgi:hypothetical protein
MGDGREVTGQSGAMNEANDLTATWIAIARGLAAISVLTIAGGVILVFGNTVVSVRDRLFEASEAASVVAVFFSLAAVVVVLALRPAGQRSRGVLLVAQCVGVVALVCAAYSAWYALTTHTDYPDVNANERFFAIVGLNWWYRAAGLIGATAVGAMAVLVLLTARRARPRRGGGLPLDEFQRAVVAMLLDGDDVPTIAERLHASVDDVERAISKADESWQLSAAASRQEGSPETDAPDLPL